MGVRSYSSSFAFTENPMSEAGIWTHGGSTGLDWTNVRTTPGKVFGTEPGNTGGGSGPTQYDDSIATLIGPWGNNQAAEAKVFIVPTAPVPNAECELLLRTTITAHSDISYEFNVSASPGINYATIVRLDGVQGTFATLAQRLDVHLVDGDVMAFTAIGSVLTAYLNGSIILGPVTDTTYPSGSPGLGFFLKGQTGNNDHYGFTSYACNDAGVIPSLGLPAAFASGPLPLRGYSMTSWA